ncbi:MAG: hypothetical protein KJ064_02940 [Anaerolineae bacterium]|nr:hypothetical protein [Anaerolineae bacterium]
MMSRELNRLTTLIILAFGLIVIGTGYWQIIERDDLRRREDNPRRVLDELNIQRGMIFDRNEEVLAYSQPTAGIMKRYYPYPAAVGAVGHYSYTFGAAGLEEGLNDWLSGSDFQNEWEAFFTDLVHHVVEGGDVKTTLDITLQQQLAAAMDGQNGGALVVHVPSGEILAMVSQPSYDPNTIEQRTNGTLLNFLPRNRVTERQFQPGGILQTLILSELLAANTPLDKPVSVKEVTLHNPSLTLACTTPAAHDLLPLSEAYLAGCPMPFVSAVGTSVNPESLLNKLQAAGLLSAARLDGFLLRTPAENEILLQNVDRFAAEAAGQGDLTITPLQAVQIIAAVVNQGNGVPLHLIEATRTPDSTPWKTFLPTTLSSAIMQPAIAGQIQMLQQEHPLAGENVYGHISRAYAGTREFIWLLAWTPLENGESIIMVVILEAKEIAPETALNIAVPILEAAARPD